MPLKKVKETDMANKRFKTKGRQVRVVYPNGVLGSDDVSGGIGLSQGSYSAGDIIACCQDSTGINRSARVEVYVR